MLAVGTPVTFVLAEEDPPFDQYPAKPQREYPAVVLRQLGDDAYHLMVFSISAGAVAVHSVVKGGEGETRRHWRAL